MTEVTEPINDTEMSTVVYPSKSSGMVVSPNKSQGGNRVQDISSSIVMSPYKSRGQVQ